MELIDIKEFYPNYNIFKQYGTIALADDGKETNGLTIGWGSIGVLWRMSVATIYINKIRYSKHIFDNANYFSINLFDENYKSQVAYYGTVSGRDEDKIANGNLSVDIIDGVKYFKEAKYVIICQKAGQIEFDPNLVYEPDIKSWYLKDGPHSAYFGKILKIMKMH